MLALEHLQLMAQGRYDAPIQDAAVNQPFYFRNETKVTQTVISQGKPFLVIPAGHFAQKIFKQKGSYVFGLAFLQCSQVVPLSAILMGKRVSSVSAVALH